MQMFLSGTKMSINQFLILYSIEELGYICLISLNTSLWNFEGLVLRLNASRNAGSLHWFEQKCATFALHGIILNSFPQLSQRLTRCVFLLDSFPFLLTLLHSIEQKRFFI